MGALVTVMVSPKLADGCAVAKDAVAALVADGWAPPERLPGFESSEHAPAEADHSQDEADQDHPADIDRQSPTGTDSHEGSQKAEYRNHHANGNHGRARTFDLRIPQVIHAPSIAQGTKEARFMAATLTPILAPHLVGAALRREEEEARQAAFEQHIRDICAPAIAWTVAWIKRRPLIHNGRKPTARRKKR